MNDRDEEVSRLWAAYLAGHEAQAHRAFQLRSRVPETRRLLARQLRQADPSGRNAALSLAAANDALALAVLDDLLWLSVSHGWAGKVRDVLTKIPAAILFPLLEEKVPVLLREAMAVEREPYDDFRRFAELLEHVRCWKGLGALVELAEQSTDSDVREVAADYARYTPLWIDQV
jgi:hypothetical protein